MLDLSAVYTEIETQVKTAESDLHVVKFGHKPQIPGAMLLLPGDVARTTHRGILKASDLQLLVLVGKADARQAMVDLFRLFAAVCAVVDPAFGNPAPGVAIHWTTCADVTITNATFDTASMAGVPDTYLAFLLHLEITGGA